MFDSLKIVMNETPVAPVTLPTERLDDKRLDRLFKYTKFHIGIYLSAGGGLVALLGSADKIDFIKNYSEARKPSRCHCCSWLLRGWQVA